MLYIAAVRAKYKPPPWNWKTDGGWNPADGILKDLINCSTKKLRRLCKRHALKNKGPRRKLIVRMYLHWRASKLEHMGIYVGKGEFFGYGPGYENIRIPTCPCGCRSRKEKLLTDKEKEHLKELQKKIKRYVMSPTIRRYPRYKKDIVHFPRL